MVIRMIEYDFAAALEFAEKRKWKVSYICHNPAYYIYVGKMVGPDFLEMEFDYAGRTEHGLQECLLWGVERYTSDVIFQKEVTVSFAFLYYSI